MRPVSDHSTNEKLPLNAFKRFLKGFLKGFKCATKFLECLYKAFEEFQGPSDAFPSDDIETCMGRGRAGGGSGRGRSGMHKVMSQVTDNTVLI